MTESSFVNKISDNLTDIAIPPEIAAHQCGSRELVSHRKLVGRKECKLPVAEDSESYAPNLLLGHTTPGEICSLRAE